MSLIQQKIRPVKSNYCLYCLEIYDAYDAILTNFEYF